MLLASVLNELRVGETRVDFLFGPTPQTLANPRQEYQHTFGSTSQFFQNWALRKTCLKA